MNARLLLGAALATVALAGACGGGSSTKATTTTTSVRPSTTTAEVRTTATTKQPPTTTLASSACVKADATFTGAMRIPAASAVKTKDHLLNGKQAWYVSTPTGATWASDMNPVGATTGGLIEPLNDQARKESETGRDTPANAPVYGSMSDSRPDAIASRKCAAG